MAVVAKDAAFKLFGRTISLHEVQLSQDSEFLENESKTVKKAETEDCRNENCRIMQETASIEPCKVELPQTSIQQTISSQDISNSQPRHNESDDSGEETKSSKRPGRIIPCPRCNSLETKFCYFNNYNVNQPRHFCKSCHRYWTAGGTVRNVPVGAGRRRNKLLASQYRQTVASCDGGPTAVVVTSDPRNHLISHEESGTSCSASSPNEMVLKFGPDSPHCDSTSNVGPRDGSIGATLSLTPDSNKHVPFLVPGCSGQSASNISVQFIPASYWNYIPFWVAGSANESLAGSNGFPVLGKHSRDTLVGESAGKRILSSKTPRID